MTQLQPLELPSSESRHWKAWCTRNSESKASLLYLRNCHRAARLFADRVFSSSADWELREVLREMHVQTVAGLVSVPTNRLNPQRLWPEMLRDELMHGSARQKAAAQETTCWVESLAESVFAQLRARSRWGRYERRRARFRYGERIYSFTARSNGKLLHIPVSGLPSPSKTKVHLFPLGKRNPIFVCEVPCAERQIRMALCAGERYLRRAIALSARKRAAGSNGCLLKSLACYHHTMVHAHPFLAQNNSVFMNQINCILLKRFQGFIPHNSLDVVALFMPAEAYVRLFCREVVDTMVGYRPVIGKRERF